MKKAILAFLAFFLTFTTKVSASNVDYLDLSGNRNTNRQFIIDSTLQNSVSGGVGYSQTINNCGFNGLQSLSFDVPEFDATKSYLVEMNWTIFSNSEYAQNATIPVWFNRANTPSTPYAFTTTTLQTTVSEYNAPNLYHTSFNLTLYAMVTPSGNGSTTKRMQIGDYVTAFNSTYLMNYPAFETQCYVPNNTTLSYRVSSIAYLEIDDSVTASIPLLLNQLIQQSSSSSGGSSVNLQSIENLLTSINTKITDLPTFINTVESDLSTIMLDLQTGNASAADTASRLSTVIGVLQTIAGDQLTSSDLANLATSSDISAQTSAITTLLQTIISNQGSSGGGGGSGSSTDLTTVESYLSSINSYISSMSSDVSSIATNTYGIAQNANTQTGYQYDIAQNTDYLPMIYNYLTGSSSSPDYSFEISNIDQSAQTSAANSNYFKTQYQSQDTSVTQTFDSYLGLQQNIGYITGEHSDNEQALKYHALDPFQLVLAAPDVNCEDLDPSVTSISLQSKYTCWGYVGDGSYRCIQLDLCTRRHIANLSVNEPPSTVADGSPSTFCIPSFTSSSTGRRCSSILDMIDAGFKFLVYFYIVFDIYKTIINMSNTNHDDKIDILDI